MIRFTLDQIEVLDAIDRGGSFAAAARALHRSTPAVSYAVKALEEALEVELFDRSGHRASLTAAGQQVLDEGRRVLDRARDLDRLGRRLRQEWEPQLEIAVDGVLAMQPVLRAVRRLTEAGAPTRIRVRVEYLSGVHRCFFEEQADLALALDLREDPTLRLRPLPAVELLLLAHHAHPLLHLGRPVERADLAEHVELVVADSGVPFGSAGASQRRRLWLGSPHLFAVGDFHTKLQAVREGVGFGWIPTHLCQGLIEARELVPLPFPEGARHVMEPQLVEWAGRRRGRGARLFVSALAQELGLSG